MKHMADRKKLEFGQRVYFVTFSYSHYDGSLLLDDQHKTFYVNPAKIINCNEKEVYLENKKFMNIDEVFVTQKEAEKEKKKLEKIEYDKYYGPNSELGKETRKHLDKVLGKGKKK